MTTYGWVWAGNWELLACISDRGTLIIALHFLGRKCQLAETNLSLECCTSSSELMVLLMCEQGESVVYYQCGASQKMKYCTIV